MPLSNITLIIRKIFDDYDEKNGAQQRTDYTKRAENIVQTWTQSIAKEGLTTELICELHRLVCEDEWIPINDPKGGIVGFAKAGEYRTTPSSAPSELKEGAHRLFILPHDIALKMEQLVATMNNLLATKLPKDTMVENILAFSVEFSTIHPFANQNGRILLSLMELLAHQAELEPFYISHINKVNPQLLIRSIEETIAYQTVQPLLVTISKHKHDTTNQFYIVLDNPFKKYKATLSQTIYQSLLPKYEKDIVNDVIKQNYAFYIDNITNYVYEKYQDSEELSFSYFSKLHTLFYAPNTEFIIPRDGQEYRNIPGLIRQYTFEPTLPGTFSQMSYHPKEDLLYLIEQYNQIKNKNIFDILKFFFEFIKIHPFSDGNLTTISLITDIECERLGLPPLHILKIRHKTKVFQYYTTKYYEENKHIPSILEEIYEMILDFHKKNFPISKYECF